MGTLPDYQRAALQPPCPGPLREPLAGRAAGAFQFSINNLWEACYKAPSPRHTAPTKPTYRYLTLLDNVGLSGSYDFAADSFRLSPSISPPGLTWPVPLLNLSSVATLDPYEYTETGQRRPRYQWAINRQPGTITQITLGAATNLHPKNTPTYTEYPASEYSVLQCAVEPPAQLQPRGHSAVRPRRKALQVRFRR